MDCRTFQRNLEDYLEGGLDFPGRFGMERHARQCLCCEQELAGAQKLGQMARELKRVSAPPNFEAEVLSRIRARGMRSQFPSLWRFWIYGLDYAPWRLAALGAVALVFLGFGILTATHWIRRDNAAQDSLIANRTAPTVSSPENSPLDSAGDPVAPPSLDPRILAPVSLEPSRTRGGYTGEDQGFSGLIEPSDYVDYLVPGPGDRPIVVRLPKTIRMQYGQPSEDYFIRNVSH
jgi:hypothetical protein